jgi:5'(3')-deoxyribonucleotidase
MSSGQQWWDDHCDAGVLGRGACSRGDCPVHGVVRTAAPRASAQALNLLCDADGVIIDFVRLVLDYVQKNTGLSYLHSAIDQWDCFAALGLQEHWPYFRRQCDELKLCRTMLPLPGAREFLTELERIANVKICTTPMTPGWLTQRAEWLEEFGVPLNRQLHFHDKHDLVPAWDVLIDDKVENCEAFVKAGGQAFCIATPYNTEFKASFHGAPRARGTHAECLAWVRRLAGS